MPRWERGAGIGAAAVGALLLVAGFGMGTAGALFTRPPGGGSTGPEWSHQTNAIPCNVPDVVTPGSCFVWAENLWSSDPYIVNVTDFSTYPVLPSNATFTGKIYGIWAFTNSTGTYAVNHTLAAHLFIEYPKAGTYTVTNELYAQECNGSTCWWNETISHSPMEAPWNAADCTIEIGCNPD